MPPPQPLVTTWCSAYHFERHLISDAKKVHFLNTKMSSNFMPPDRRNLNSYKKGQTRRPDHKVDINRELITNEYGANPALDHRDMPILSFGWNNRTSPPKDVF